MSHNTSGPPRANRHNESDLYRPQAQRDNRQSHHINRDDGGREMYKFGGYDSRAPSYSQPSPARGYASGTGPSTQRGYAPSTGPTRASHQERSIDTYRPSNSGYNSVAPPSYGRYEDRDSYRPQDRDGGSSREAGGFSFRHDAPPSIDFRNSDRFQQRDTSRNQNNTSFRQNRNQQKLTSRPDRPDRGRGGARGGYRGRGGPRTASDRAFLKTNRSPTPELMQGMAEDGSGEVKYRPVEELSDSDEAEMEISDDDAPDGDAQQPSKKQARGIKAADGDSVPKWSNPDPYTSLPALLDENKKPTKDMVNFIRKSRVEDVKGIKSTAAADDFISFNDPEDDAEEDEEPESEFKPAQAAEPYDLTGDDDDVVYITENRLDSTKAAYSHLQNIHGNTHQQPRERTPQLTANPPQGPSSGLTASSDPALGNRKRTIRDEIRGPPRVETMKGKKSATDGSIQRSWQLPRGTDGTPWLADHSNTAKLGVWLHMEILDFYNHFKPRGFEGIIRRQLIDDLSRDVKDRFGNDIDILSFGSFPSGLYLPQSDMDLVLVSQSYMSGGRAMFGKNMIHKFAAFLRTYQLAQEGSIEPIMGAKVPLVKYVDKVTGLKVDISFENDSGLAAIKTFLDWKEQYPCVPILVTLIKQFLMMRGLNEPVNGGIGGFSTACLVVSLLQNMPQVQSGAMVPEHHLGEILMEFFDLYGKEFNTVTTAISLNPPGYIPKSRNHKIIYRNSHVPKFSIMDPNDQYNDISGGSSNTATITRAFALAHDALQRRMVEMSQAKTTERANQSLLGCILAGNYSDYHQQRAHLAQLHEQMIGPVMEDY